MLVRIGDDSIPEGKKAVRMSIKDALKLTIHVKEDSKNRLRGQAPQIELSLEVARMTYNERREVEFRYYNKLRLKHTQAELSEKVAKMTRGKKRAVETRYYNSLLLRNKNKKGGN